MKCSINSNWFRMNIKCPLRFQFYLKLTDHLSSLCTVLGITAITTTLLNSLILFSIWRTPSLHKPSFILIANLALADFLTGAVAEPLTVLLQLTVIMKWKGMFCQMWLGGVATGYALGFVSIYTVTCMSVDRFLAVKLSNRYRRSTVTVRRTASATLSCWIVVALLVTLTPVLENVSRSTRIIFMVVILTLLVTIITACSSMAFFYLKRMSSSISPSNNSTTHGEPTPEHQNININKYRRSLNTMLLVILCMLIFYLPLIVSGIVVTEATKKAGQEFSDDSSTLLGYKLAITAEVISLMNSTVNPLLYLWRIQELRRAVFLRLRIIFRREMPGNPEQQGQP